MNWLRRHIIVKQLHHWKWILLPLLGLGLGLILFLLRSHNSLTTGSLAPSSPMPSSSIGLSSPLPVSPSPASQTTPTPKAPAPSPKPQSPPASRVHRSPTPNQAALNQENKAAFTASLPTVDSLIEMRVAIAEGISSTTLRTSTDAVFLDRDGKTLYTLTSDTTYPVEPGDQSIQLGSTHLPMAALLDPRAEGIFYLGDRPYRGRLLLIAEAGRLWAVNIVGMRSYLYSVVGSEVSPSWNLQALKAQAVAARSYALTYYFRPINPAYHLGATEYYQVYKGIESEATTTREAVDSTAGEFVSHRGGIVESLYAASEDIVMEAFQGRGMSQLGALDLANRGYTYQQILSKYYPDTGVGRISKETE